MKELVEDFAMCDFKTASIFAAFVFSVTTASAVVAQTTATLETPKEVYEPLRKSLMAGPKASTTSTPAKASPGLKKAWDSYVATLDEMRAVLERTSMFENPRNRARAYRTLMEMQAMVYNSAVAPRMATPRIVVNNGWMTDIYPDVQIGPDWYYGLLYLDGRQTYQLKGRLGDIKLFLFQVNHTMLGVDNSRTIGNYNLADMDVAADGTFEITIGGARKERNWIALEQTSKYNFIQIRRYLPNSGHDDPGYLRIKLLSASSDIYAQTDEFDEAALAERIHNAELQLRLYINEFNVGLYDFAMVGTGGQKNRMSLIPGLTLTAGNPLSKYSQGVFSLKDDEAIIVDIDKSPSKIYWGLMLCDVWSRSLPFNNWQTSINNVHAKRDADGHYRFVLSKQDPGVANWLDTRGMDEGIIMLRNYVTEENVVPSLRLVKFNEVLNTLPSDTSMVTPDQRQTALEYRREGYTRLYGE